MNEELMETREKIAEITQLIEETKEKPTAIIPARKGSNRLKGKNKALLNGKPLVEYTIEAAVQSEVFGMIIVSSDDMDILDIAIKHFNHGVVQPHKRPTALSGDNVWIRDLCRFLIETYGFAPIFSVLQPTNPFCAAEDIKKAYDLLWKNEANYVISIAKSPQPPQMALEIKDSYLKPYWGIENFDLAQKLKPLYYPDGSIIFARTKVFLEEFALDFFAGSKALPYFMERSIDIHTAEDLAYAEVLMKNGK